MNQARVESDRDKLAVLSPPAQDSLKAALQEDERVLWAGKPVALAAWCDPMPGNITSRRVCAILYIVTAGLALYVLVPLLVILLAYIVDRLRGNFSWWDIVTLPIVAFLLLAALHFLAMVAFPWISISRARRRSYVLTSSQAITINESDQGVELLRHDLGDVAAPTVSRLRGDGVGNVIFDGYSVTQTTGDGGMDLTAHFARVSPLVLMPKRLQRAFRPHA